MKKNIVIIGASSGIGAELTKILLAQGNHVYSYSRNQPEFTHESLQHQTTDVTHTDFQLNQLPDIIDGLVYCPGTINLKPVRRLTTEDIINDFNINALGAIKTVQQAYKGLRKSTSASIVLFSSVAVQTGMAFHTSIAAAKGAVEGITRSLAAELAPTIRVNAIAPSLTDTPLAETFLSTDEKKTQSAQKHPLKRVGTASDQAEIAAYLLSEKAGWMIGEILHIDGGMSHIR